MSNEPVIFGGITQREALLKKSTGWSNGLSQGYNKQLGTWFTDRLGARNQLRRDMETTDRGLLELAAKAAGIELMEWTGDSDLTCPNMFWSPSLKQYWSPITDDGDALRLAVKLKLMCRLQDIVEKYNTIDQFESEPYEATRRAIVRAAAEIGRNMK